MYFPSSSGGRETVTHPLHRRLGSLTPHLSIALALVLCAVPALAAGPVQPGIDLFVTPPGTFVDFSASPIPADFFGPGSDPFTGIVNLVGQPLPQVAPADTIVERLQTANIMCGDTDTIDIELVALRLVGTQPITVTFNGGMSPTLFDVQVCRSSVQPSLGTMTINHECLDGGTFDSNLNVVPKYNFTNITTGMVIVLDPGDTKTFTANSFWVHDPMLVPALTAPPGVQVDGDCDGFLDPALPGTTNFFPGIEPVPCNSCTPSEMVTKIPRPIPHVAPNAEHGVVGIPLIDGVSIPTLSTWGLLGIAALLAALGAWALHRRRREALES